MINPHQYYQNHIFKSEFYQYLNLNLEIDTVISIMSSISLNSNLVHKKKAHKIVINLIKYLKFHNYNVDDSKIIAMIRLHDGKNQLINTCYQLFKLKRIERLKEYIFEKTLVCDKASIILFNFKHYSVSEVSCYEECRKIGMKLGSCVVGEKHIAEIKRGRCLRLMIQDKYSVVATIRIDRVTNEVYGYGFNYTQINQDQLKELVLRFNSSKPEYKIPVDMLNYITHGKRHDYNIYL